jgi:F1F0 ATPase subunit 2
MTSFVALMIGAAVAWIYCASLWFAVNRAVEHADRAILWLALTSFARLTLVGGLFCILAMRGAEVVLLALVGFSLAHTATTYAMGGHAHGR